MTGTNKYIEQFLRSKCAPDMLARGLFPNAKEITESWSAVNAVRRHSNLDLGDRSITLVSVGDGHTPRTAATFAFRTAWDCDSIDPLLRDKNWRTERLRTHPYKVEDITPISPLGDTIVLVCVHSHADLNAAVSKLRNWTRLVIAALPCCKPQELTLFGGPYKPMWEWTDPHIQSPKNTWKLWDIKRYAPTPIWKIGDRS